MGAVRPSAGKSGNHTARGGRLPEARWNGIDGVDERAYAPFWRIGIRHAVADAARDWPRVLEILNKHGNL